MTIPSQNTSSRGDLVALVLLLLAHTALVAVLIARPDSGSQAWDQNYHHAIVVARFAATTDDPNFRDYSSATSPGYHLALAAMSRMGLISDESWHALYPWTKRDVTDTEVVRRSLVAQGMSELRQTGIRSILETLCKKESNAQECGAITRMESKAGTPADHDFLVERYGVEGKAFAAWCEGDHQEVKRCEEVFWKTLLPLRFIQLAVSLMLIAAVWRTVVWIGCSGWTAGALTLPLALNPYVVAGGAWITTDSASILCIVIVIAGCLRALRDERLPSWTVALAAIGAVSIRQSSIWVEGAIASSIAITLLQGSNFRPRDWLAPLVALIVPCAVVIALAMLWGGLVPPAYVSIHKQTINPTALVLFLATLALWGSASALVLNWIRRPFPWLIGIAVLIVAIWIPTDRNVEVGRFGGVLWTIAAKTGSFSSTSPFLVVAAAVGAIAAARIASMMGGHGHQREVVVLAAAGALCAAALAANPMSFERYAEIPILAVLPMALAFACAGNPAAEVRVRRVAIVSALLALALTLSLFVLPALEKP
ncbi:MAG: hypothetical protein O2800_01880 [Planctomycetota bacterium]|nr:hypothetical protein [Planctomycetota bacterium]